jgi:hypothetical protein
VVVVSGAGRLFSGGLCAFARSAGVGGDLSFCDQKFIYRT